MSIYTKLSIIPVNKSVIMSSPLEGEYTLCRTGTIGEGSCFLHSILHSYSSKYISLSVSKRMDYIKKLRKSLSSSLTEEKWEKLGEGLISKIAFQEKFLEILSSFYSNDNGDKMFNLITNIIKLELFEKIILPKIYKKYEKDSINIQQQKIIKYSIIYFKKLNKDLELVKIFKKILQNILKNAKEQAFSNYIENLYSSSTYIDEYFIEIISNYFNRDIFFIDGNTRMLYQNASKNNIKNRKSIILVWINNCHYEIGGKLSSSHKIQREFETTDPLILKLKMFLCNPEQIQKNYPELTEYLPTYYKKKSIHPKSPPRNLELDNSDIESEYSPRANFRVRSGSENEYSSFKP